MPINTEVTITEIEEFEPSRVDGVGKGANGFPILMLKQLDGDAEKADDSPPCKTCDGSGKIMEGNRKCPDCFGTGKAPKVGESVKAFAERVTKEDRATGVAPSGSGPTPATDCPTCDGTGKIDNKTAHSMDCPDCGGTGKDQSTTNPSDLKAVNADPGRISMGDPDGREAIDKAAMSSADTNDLPDSAFAYVEDGGKKDADGKTTPRSLRHFPVHDKAHAQNALARASQSPFGAKALPAIKAAAKKFGIEVSDDASKATADGAVFTAANPALAAPDTSSAGDGSGTDPDDAATPGSPAWEAVDAATATAAALALTNASELIRQFAQRESIEVAAGQGNDTFDAYAATAALSSVSDALGIMAQLAFHEGLEAQKGIGDDEDADTNVEKAGKRLSGPSVAALAAARDKAKELSTHLTEILADDDPAKTNKTKDNSGKSAAAKFIQNANKALLAKEIETMSTDELEAVLDSRDEKLVGIIAEALKGKSLDDQNDSVAGAKNANASSKNKKPKKNNFDLEDEQDAGDDDAGSDDAAKAESDKTEKHAKANAVKAELTPEEIEARAAKKAAKKQLKKAERAEKAAAEYAKVRKAVEEATAEVQKTNAVLTERLEAVEKMAAPGGPVRTRTQDAITKSAERDAIDLEIARYESLAKSTDDRELATGYREAAKQLRAKLATL